MGDLEGHMSHTDASTWSIASVDAFEELCETALDCGFEVAQSDVESPRTGVGATISLVANGENVVLALVADAAGCRTLAAGLMGMEPDEAAELDDSEVADGVGEVVNMWAGLVKTRMNGDVPGIALGLPMFVDGHVEGVSSTERVATEVRIGGVRATVAVVRQSAA
jgi:CheY-specific phosphatase CheX